MKIFVAILFILSPLLTNNVFACQCQSVPTIYDSFKKADAVFVGRTTDLKIVEYKRLQTNNKGVEIESIDKGKIYKFRVTEGFKGSLKKDSEINIAGFDNMCESGFEIGKSYLIYAYFNNKREFYTWSFCALNNELKHALGQIHFIRQLLKGKPEPQIYGSLILYGKEEITYTKGIKIIVEGDGKRFETITDNKGLFRLEKIPKGKYIIKPIVPDIYDVVYPGEEEFRVLTSSRIFRGNDLDIFQDLFSENKEFDEAYETVGTVSNGLYAEFYLERNKKQTSKNQKNR